MAQKVEITFEERDERKVVRWFFIGGRNSIEIGSLPVESVANLSGISPIALIEIQPMSREYGMNRLVWVILNSLQNSSPSINNTRENRHIVRLAHHRPLVRK
ncbi:hypothetical protein TNCV_4308331 [Trichonephila clavipes]|nr:hypothetical protein TNCV_4308331 [Trichonephila clavipes]